MSHGLVLHRLPQLAIAVLSLTVITHTYAAKPGSTPSTVEWENGNLQVADDTTGHSLTWDAFTGFNVFGYDVHYSASTPTTADNNTRIETGANNGQWTDNLDGYTSRCNAGRYWIQAYTRGRKNYSTFVQSAQNPDGGELSCNDGGSGGGETGGGSGGGETNGLEPASQTYIDGYDDTKDCGVRDQSIIDAVAGNALWSSEFNSLENLSTNWKSHYAWRDASNDVVINNESQYYIDALGNDSSFGWSPFVHYNDSVGNGYLGIWAVKTDSVLDKNGIPEPYAGQDYLSGVLTTRGKHDMTEGIIEVRARMPRGNGLWPAIWLNHTRFTNTSNSEVDGIEYIAQSPADLTTNATDEVTAWTQQVHGDDTKGYDTWHTQYHNFHRIVKGKRLKSLHSLMDEGAIYTNPDSPTTWRPGPDYTWKDCQIDFSKAFHTYTVKWNSMEIVWYIDHIEVLRVDKDNFSSMPPPTEPMYLVLNLAMGSDLPPWESWPGAPDDYTRGAMDRGETIFMIDYVRHYSWQQ